MWRKEARAHSHNVARSRQTRVGPAREENAWVRCRRRASSSDGSVPTPRNINGNRRRARSPGRRGRCSRDGCVLRRVAFVRAAQEPAHQRASARPFDEGVDAGRMRHPAAILPVMDDERARQRGRRSQDRHHIAGASGFGAEQPRGEDQRVGPRTLRDTWAARTVPRLVAITHATPV
jgi:hypothetical protein